jgi:IS5 family transposase
VVETTIHHPTDSTLLYDGVRVLSRTVVKAQHVIQQTSALARPAFRDRPRSAQRHMTRIMDAARKRGGQAGEGMRTAYERLLTLPTAVVQQAEQGQAVLRPQTTPKAQPCVET